MTRPIPTSWIGIGSLIAACALALSGCSGSQGSSASTGAAATSTARPSSNPATAARPAALSLPPEGARFSYQIGDAYPVPAGAGIVDRDRSAAAADTATGVYSICYLNAFQAQADAVGWWSQHHPELLLHDAAGALVIDTGWNEPLFDLHTPAKRAAILKIVGGWMDGCADAGYRAIEPDNLDSYTRSHGLLGVSDALAFSRLLVARAHRDHLAIAQKNAGDIAAQAREAGFDFAIAEECQLYNECNSYTAVYGRHVIEIEYTDNPRSAFSTACALRGHAISVTLRDRDVSPAGASHYVEQWCS